MKKRNYENRFLGYVWLGLIFAGVFALYVLIYWLLTGELPKSKP